MNINFSFFICLLLMALMPSTIFAEEHVPAFPGAEGHGRYTTGGRGGTIYHVTTLADSGEGSLRDALESKSGARIIVFDVAGYIDLKSQLTIKNGNVTIAGQTAPAPGITIRYYTVQNKASNVIVRFIRFRRSQVKDMNDSADASWGRQCRNIIFDHCSFSWSIDEVASYYDNTNFTMQWCTIGEGLNNAGHGKGAHGYGGIWGGKPASFHHNLLIHNNNRSPRINSGRYNYTSLYDKSLYDNAIQAEIVDFRNCVNYNWGQGNGAYGNMGGYLNIVNNYYKAGPGTKNKTRVFQCSLNNSSDSKGVLPDKLCGRYYISGNYVEGGGENYDWKGVIRDNGDRNFTKNGEFFYIDTIGLNGVRGSIYGEGDTVAVKLTKEVDAGKVTTHDAVTAFDHVLQYAGMSIYRDAVDARYAEETRTGTVTYKGNETKVAGIIDKIEDPNSEYRDTIYAQFPIFEQNKRSDDFDTDGDGIPDEWEILNGLNPNDASDANTYTLDIRGWYTNIEVYLSKLVENIMKEGNKNAIVDIEEYYPEVKGTSIDVTNYYIVDTRSKVPITNIEYSSQIVRFEYYTLDGHLVSEPQNGISVRRTFFSDGHIKTDKVLKK